MPFTLVFVVATLLERFVNLEVGSIRLGPGDIVVLLALPYCFFKFRTIQTVFVVLALCFFFVLLTSIIFNNTSYGFNALLTVPMRIIAAGVIANELLLLDKSKVWALTFSFLYVLSVVLAFFFSDGSPLIVSELFNRNELLCYSVVFMILALYCFMPGEKKLSSISVKHIGVLVVLFVVAILIQSRQNVLAIIFSFVAVFLLMPIKRKVMVFFVSSILFFLVSPIVLQEVDSNERLSARVSTVTELDPATRADKYRLNNIYQAIIGFQKSPLYGNGPTSFRRDNLYDKVAHSTPFSILYELGILGLLLLLYMYYLLLKASYYLRKFSRVSSSLSLLSALLPVIIVQSFFIELLPKAPLYVYLALSVVLINRFGVKSIQGDFDSHHLNSNDVVKEFLN